MSHFPPPPSSSSQEGKRRNGGLGMVALPRLSPRAEHRVLKAACGLGPRSRRRLFGEPPSIDGQRLGAEAHVLTKLAGIAGDTTLIAGMTVEEARESTRRR